jgi:RNA polymerase sigma-70 factor (ECF subfamily)
MKDLPKKELQELLNQIALGDNKAVEKLYRHYQASLFAFIRLRVRDDSAAEEILNDTFMIAIQKPEQYTGDSTYKTWLCGIAKNVCGTWMRKQQSGINKSTVDVEEEIFENLADPNWGILEQIETRERDEIMRECIDALPETHREAFYWTWFEEESMESVAERLDCPVGTIKSRLFNARAKIADCVRNAFPEGGTNV